MIRYKVNLLVFATGMVPISAFSPDAEFNTWVVLTYSFLAVKTIQNSSGKVSW